MINDEAIQVAGLLGNVMKVQRKRAGKTQTEVAEHMGVDQARISCIEKGENQPQISTIISYCNAIGLDPFDFVLEALRAKSPEKMAKVEAEPIPQDVVHAN